jgi:NAD(P)-dependent dehydrogenase (short-subunit alcohol dehydrogenase family)
MSENGKTVVITGASKGIGLATAQRLARSGYDVVGWSRNEPEEFPGTWMRGDIASADSVQAAIDQTLARGPVHCVVHNAGLPTADKIGQIPLQQLWDSLDFHARSTLQLLQGFTPGMKERGWGRFVHILTMTLSGYTERTCYRAGKEAIKSLTISAALELAKDGITVNGVSPGPTATATYYATNPPGSKGERYWISLNPMGRFGKEDEIAATVEFFLSEDAGYITGQILFVDGGTSVGTVIDV